MASINYAAREISVKIVYYGPGLSGKTTNLQVIHKKVPPEFKSDMVSLATETDRTLFFDFLPLDLGKIKGFSTKFQLYTVPGQVYYNATRKLVLRGVDGVVFVADSSPDKVQENLESFQNLEDNLAEYGYQRETVPIIIQYNKRDLPNALSIEELHNSINKYNLPWGEAVANKGKGVFDSLKQIGKIVIDSLNKRYSRPQRTSAPVAANVATPIQEEGRRVQPPVQQPAPPAAQRRPIVPPVQQQRSAFAPQPLPQRPQPPAQQRPATQNQQIRQSPAQSDFRQQPLAKPQSVQSVNQELRHSGDLDTFEVKGASQNNSPFSAQPVAEQSAQDDYLNYGSIQLESMQSRAPQGQRPTQANSMSMATPEVANKTDLDLEIEKYQREIEEKQRRMRTAQPTSGQQASAKQFTQPAEIPAFQQPASSSRPQYAPQQQSQNDYDVYNVDTSTSFNPPEQKRQSAQPRPQPTASSEDGDDLYFTSIDTDRQKKPVKRPVNPRNKPQKGFLSKLFNRDTP